MKIIEIKLLLLLCVFGIFILIIAISVYGTVAKNRWGVNLNPLVCPVCGAVPTPGISLRRSFWGGRTCEVCGTKMDNWGRIIEHKKADGAKI